MVVDDHPIWRDAVARDLADDGFDVVATADGVASAKRRAAVVKPDVVLMDCQMPVLDGYDATRELRLRELTQVVPPLSDIYREVTA